MTITVDVISDVICPWCWIGKRRLEKAIVALGMPVKIRWLPFQLNPMMPEEGIRRQAYRIQKFGSWERSQELDVRVAAVGKEEGIDFAFDRIERTPNTQAAHRLIWLAEQEGIQGVVVEALFRAYFTDGRDISNRQTLLDVVAEAGLDRASAEAMLQGNDGLEAIRDAESLSRRHHLDGVPFFIINGTTTLAHSTRTSFWQQSSWLLARSESNQGSIYAACQCRIVDVSRRGWQVSGATCPSWRPPFSKQRRGGLDHPEGRSRTGRRFAGSGQAGVSGRNRHHANGTIYQTDAHQAKGWEDRACMGVRG